MSGENGHEAWIHPLARDFNEIFDALVHSVQKHRISLPFGTK